MDVFLNLLNFPKTSALSQKLALVHNQLAKLGEVYMINFLMVMWGLKLPIKAGTSKNSYNRISEWSLQREITQIELAPSPYFFV